MQSLKHLPVYLLFGAITLGIYAPVIENMNTALPVWSKGMRNAALFYAQRGAEKLLKGESPLYYEEIYYPVGAKIYEGMYPTLLFSFLGIFFNPFFAQNLFSILSFLLSAIGMYHLALYLSGERTGAILAGIYFSFSPFHIMNRDPFPIFSIEWIPFFLLYLFKSIQFPSSIMYPFLSGIFFTLASLSSWYYGVSLILFCLIYTLYNINSPRIWIKPILKIAFFSFLFLLFPFLNLISLASHYAGWSPDVIIRSTPDLLSFFIPSPNHPIFAQYFKKIYANYVAYPLFNSNYLTYTALFIAFLLMVKKRKGLPSFFFLTAVLFFVISLGAVLMVNGEIIKIKGHMIKLPSYFLAKHLKFARAPSRYCVIILTCLGVLISFGIKYLKEKYIKKSWIPVSLFSLFLFLEILPSQIPAFFPPEVPDFYKNLDREEGDFSILELPFDPYKYLIWYYSMHHHKKVMGGAGDNTFIPFWHEITKFPFLHQLITSQYKEKLPCVYYDVIEYDLQKTSASVASYFNIKYAVLHKEDGEGFRGFFESAGWKLQKEDEYIYVFTPPEEGIPFVAIGRGWSHIQLFEKKEPIRWMRKSATLEIISPEEGTVELSFNMVTLKSSPVSFFIDEKEIKKEELPPFPIKKEILLTFPVKKGKNILKISGGEISYGIMKIKIQKFF
jgi:hypothetical protein